jgi:hypothetical protein
MVEGGENRLTVVMMMMAAGLRFTSTSWIWHDSDWHGLGGVVGVLLARVQRFPLPRKFQKCFYHRADLLASSTTTN